MITVSDPSADGRSPSIQNSVLSIRSLSKRFGGTLALDDVGFDLREGEILALLGQNGAGKSTLIKILAGIHKPDSGAIHLDGKPFDPSAKNTDIAFIHQDLGLIEWMTVAENIAMAKGYPLRFGMVDWKKTVRMAEDAMAVVASGIDPRRRVAELSRTEKSLVAIARAIGTNARLVILDEPTASLPRHEVNRLFEVLRSLRDDGRSMIYVSHRLDEIYALSDRLVVLRDGRKIAEDRTAETQSSALVQMIIGKPADKLFQPPQTVADQVRLQLDGVVTGDVGPVDLKVARGEILGLAGLRGAGQEEIGRLLFGLAPLDDGTVTIDGERPDLASPASAIRSGIGFVAGDRNAESIASGLTVRENMFLNPGASGRTIGGWLAPSSEAAMCRKLGRDVHLRPNDPLLSIEMLSGGNQQKVVMARWMNVGGKVLVLEDPTAGVDVGARAEIYRLLSQAVEGGLSVILVSTDLEEVCQICHRAVVFRNGAFAAELDRSRLTLDRIVAAASLDERIPQNSDREVLDAVHPV